MEIFYIHNGVLLSVSVGSRIAPIGLPKELFRIPELTYTGDNLYDVSPDSKRFLFAVAAGDDTNEPRAIHVIENWPALLRKQ